MNDSVAATHPLHTCLGVPLAIVTWAVVFLLAHFALYLLDLSRGLSDDWLQGIFRELFTPGVGGYAALMVVNKFLAKANLRVVGIVYCGLVAGLLVTSSVYILLNFSGHPEFPPSEQAFNLGAAVCTCIGTYFSLKKIEA